MMRREGFSLVELLIAMVIAAAFLLTGYQTYQFVEKSSTAARSSAKISDTLQSYMTTFKQDPYYYSDHPFTCSPYDPYIPYTNQNITVDGVSNTRLSVSQGCKQTFAQGLVANYFNNTTFSGPIPAYHEIVYGGIDNNWGAYSPNALVNVDTWSVWYTGYITVPTTGTYTFYSDSDDGAYLSVDNGNALINKLVNQSETEWSSTTSTQLTAGVRYNFTYKMYDSTGNAIAHVSWLPPGGTKGVIPGSAFSHETYVSSTSVTLKYDSPEKVVSSTVYQSGCMDGFIKVPGDNAYGTTDFCVMEYEASQGNSYNGVTTAVSKAWSTPWGANGTMSTGEGMTMKQAVALAQTACDNCHLVTTAEWMTIAKNVMNVASNWSSGTVGTGYIYSGHNDNNPSSPQPAGDLSSGLVDGYYLTGNSASSGANQRRTLTLSNGEVIWDLAGNLTEWVQGSTLGLQPGLSTDSAYGWKEWNNSSLLQHSFQNILYMPLTFSGLSSSNGIGRLKSNYNDTTSNAAFNMGGHYTNTINAGVLSLSLDPSATATGLGYWYGFRAAYALGTTSQ